MFQNACQNAFYTSQIVTLVPVTILAHHKHTRPEPDLYRMCSRKRSVCSVSNARRTIKAVIFPSLNPMGWHGLSARVQETIEKSVTSFFSSHAKAAPWSVLSSHIDPMFAALKASQGST